MSLIATFRLSSPMLPLVGAAGGDVTEMLVERFQTANPDSPVIVCWVEASSFERFEESLDTEGVEELSVLEVRRERRLYHVRLRKPLLFPLKEAFDSCGATPTGGTVIREDGWVARARFPDRDAIVQFRRACKERRVTFHLESLFEANPDDQVHAGLTPKQREALLLAYGSGYYNVPRRISLGDLGDQLGISKPSVSSRLRRAEQRVIRSAVETDGI